MENGEGVALKVEVEVDVEKDIMVIEGCELEWSERDAGLWSCRHRIYTRWARSVSREYV